MNDFVSLLRPYAELGPLLSGTALMLSAIIGGITLVIFHLQTRDNALYESLSKLYQRFWSDERLFRVRRWIDSDPAFEEIRPAIEVLNQPQLTRHLTPKEAEEVDALDKFCALMMEAYFLREMGNNRRRRRIVDSMFLDHWLDQFASRPELRAYMQKFWPELYRCYGSNRLLRRKLKRWRLRNRKDLQGVVPAVAIVSVPATEH